METFKDHPQLGRFTLRDEGLLIFDLSSASGFLSFFFLNFNFFLVSILLSSFSGRTVAIGKILKVIDREGETAAAPAAAAAAPAVAAPAAAAAAPAEGEDDAEADA